jgi:hypothetical protein
MNIHKKVTLIILCVTAGMMYYLAGIIFNPLIVWTALPLYLSYWFINSAVASNSDKKLFAGYGFMLFSVLFSIFYHFTWYLDWQGTKTSSSSSALIFIWLPLYSVVLGFVGYGIGTFTAMLYQRSR